MSSIYAKPPLNIIQQIQLLESRGMIFIDKDNASRYLQFINYYRFSGYTICFEELTMAGARTHRFKCGTTFEDILSLYHFDSKLRSLVMSAIEKIEVAIRTQICLNMAVMHQDSHWHLNSMLFKPSFDHDAFVKKCATEQQTSKEHFVRHYQATYDIPVLTPCWMTIELLPMGSWSVVYKNLRNRADRKTISYTFGLSPQDFESWLHVLTYVRNLCAHHSRLWNRHFTLRPAQVEKYKTYLSPNTTFYAQSAIINALLWVIESAEWWPKGLLALLHDYPIIDSKRMGFPENWYADPFWTGDLLRGTYGALNNNKSQKIIISQDKTFVVTD